MPTNPRLGFLVASALCFVAGAVAFDFIFESGGGGILGLLLLYAPFVVLALMAASLEQNCSRSWAVVFFAVFVCVLGGLDFLGFRDADLALAQRKWTAAALSLGFPVLARVPVLVVAGVVAFLIRKVHERGSNRQA